MRSQQRTIDSPYLKKQQQGHARTVNITAFLGAAVALVLPFLAYPIGAVEVWVFVVMFLLTETGVTVGFHRHFTHRSFKAKPFVRVILAILGSMSAQGSLVFWAALHRWHHEFSDQKGDPHSPYVRGDEPLSGLRGFWHSYLGWTTNHGVPNPYHYTPDLVQDAVISKINRHYLSWIFLGLAIPTLLSGILTTSLWGALYGFLWGGLLRIFISLNLVLFITSLAHIIGHQSYKSGDHSTNNIWFAIPTLGESWHNNHHAFPNAAVVGWRWWQVDISGWVILLLEKLGLVWDVNIPTHEMRKNKKLVATDAKSHG